jgi:hypothetical protein
MVSSYKQPSHVGVLKRHTEHYDLEVPYFDTPGWGAYIEEDLDDIDALLFAAIGMSNVKGIWMNATAYILGDRVFDGDTGAVYQCAVAHTSAATGTFAQDRTAHPTFWFLVNTDWNFRGAWTPATFYQVGDLVFDEANHVVAVASVAHTSTSDIRTDAANWDFIVDLANTVAQAELAATQAAASASSASTSASSASTSASNALTSANNAANSASSATSSASAALASKNAAAISETNAATSATTASNAATAATTAKNAAELALDQFTDLYLGAFPADPTLDNDGNALQDGALYWNTASNTLKGYSVNTGSWHVAATSATGLVEEAPLDAKVYARVSATWTESLSKTSIDAANAAQDAVIAAKIGDAPNDGGYYGRRNVAWTKVDPYTLTNAANPKGTPAAADTFGYMDITSGQWVKIPFNSLQTAVGANYLPLIGGTLTGPLTLSGAPSNGLHAATKTYVDAVQTSANTKVAKAGDTMTGDLTIAKGSAGLILDATAGTYGLMSFQKASVLRWTLGKNASDDFELNRWSAAGAYQSTPITVLAASGSFVMQGDVLVNKATPLFGLNKQTATETATVGGLSNWLDRWKLVLGTGEAESGANAGSNFSIEAYNDAGSAKLFDALKINRADAMSVFGGNVTVRPPSAPFIAIQPQASGQSSVLYLQGFDTSAKNRWNVGKTNTAESTGTNVGSNFVIGRYSDAGTFIDNPFAIDRASGTVTLLQGIKPGNVILSDIKAFEGVDRGTFTPVFVAAGGTFSYNSQGGSYIRVGRIVYFRVSLILNTTGNTIPAAALSVQGLPYTPNNSGNGYAVVWTQTASSFFNFTCRNSAAVLNLIANTAASITNLSPTNANVILSPTLGTRIEFGGTYATDDAFL